MEQLYGKDNAEDTAGTVRDGKLERGVLALQVHEGKEPLHLGMYDLSQNSNPLMPKQNS